MLSIGSAAARATLRPLAGAASVALGVGLKVERKAVGRVLDSPELERVADAAFDSRRVQVGFAKALESDAARELVDTFFASSLFERVIIRLLESKELWLIVEEVADSPAVTAAITGQGLGFAEVVGTEVRQRSRRTDDWLERKARRFSRGHATGRAADGEAPGSGGGP